MKNYVKHAVVAIVATTALLSSCKKDNEREQILGKETVGIYVLSEGSMGSENSAITYYDIEKNTTVKDYYKQVNGKSLGETATDLKVYGSKMYCVVSGIQGAAKSFVEVMDVNTGKTIKRISFNSATEGFLPRSITFHGGKAYVSRYDGKISRIDTTGLTIEADLQLKNGANDAQALEGLTVANGNLYIAGSDFYLYPNSFKNKVVVVNISTFTQTKEITVNHNPQKITVTPTGDLFVASSGNYVNIQPALQKISSTTNEVVGTYDINAGSMAFVGNNQIVLSKDWGAGLVSFNTTTGATESTVIKDGTVIKNAYGITANPDDKSIVVADALAFGSAMGKAFIFDTTGKLKYSFETAATPQHAAFKTKFVYKNF